MLATKRFFNLSLCFFIIASTSTLASEWNGKGIPPQLEQAKQFSGKTEFPMIEGPLLNGGHYSLAQQKGKVVIVQLWSVVCSYCHKELPSLQSFVDKNKARGLEHIGLSVDDTEQEIHAYLKKNPNLHFPIVWRLGDQEKDGFARARGTPTTYVIGRDGTIKFKMWGVLKPEDYQWIEKLLNEKS